MKKMAIAIIFCLSTYACNLVHSSESTVKSYEYDIDNLSSMPLKNDQQLAAWNRIKFKFHEEYVANFKMLAFKRMLTNKQHAACLKRMDSEQQSQYTAELKEQIQQQAFDVSLCQDYQVKLRILFDKFRQQQEEQCDTWKQSKL